ncbi:hypothetical protein TRSC58_03296 [Trypanosoma rangeli SC58]|uniref:Ribosomal RNA methyltransferase FtsJ domain-containing protein n=1 Tax=Trypanosoma rangeli SC58 TaxID=429131 RepID=A0A061J4D8_TRYRA|nr:hypothetical protein TRSC58_03296 [Trypanosoma rangeli SC58]
MYRCRSAHKLLELDAVFQIFAPPCCTVVDLAAAPGGFAEVALERMARAAATSAAGPRPVVVAFDNRPIEPMQGLLPVVCDINDHRRVMAHTSSLLRGMQGAGGGPERAVHVVLHDGVSVVKAQSSFSVTYGQNQMALGALRLACSFFALPAHATSARRAKTLVTKAMYSTHFNALLEICKRYFHCVHVHKPTDCKPESPETYIVARDFSARRWLAEERRAKGLHPHLTLPPYREDVTCGRQIMWRCWGCCELCLGTSPCPLCVAAER